MRAACCSGRLRAPLYEVALSARVALPGESAGAAGGGAARGACARSRRRLERGGGARAAEGTLPVLARSPLGEAVSEVVMVGGASRMAAVRKLVTNRFGVDPRKTVDPMAAVALAGVAPTPARSRPIDGEPRAAGVAAQLGILDAARAGAELENRRGRRGRGARASTGDSARRARGGGAHIISHHASRPNPPTSIIAAIAYLIFAPAALAERHHARRGRRRRWGAGSTTC